MKKLFAFAAIVAAVSFSSCGNKSAESTEAVAEQPAVEEVAPAVEEAPAVADSAAVATEGAPVEAAPAQ